MEISNDLLIDVALNAVGFVLAGFLMTVIYSMIGRKDKVARNSQVSTVANSNPASAQANGRAGAKIEFIDFHSKGNSAAKSVVTNESQAGRSSQFQRNRMEVIKQATEMLKNGQMTQDIRRYVPVTDSEMQTSNQGRKVLAKRGTANDQ